MRKTLFIILCTFPLYIFAQSEKKNFFEAGALMGLNADQVDGDGLVGFNKLALNTGLIGCIPLYKRDLFLNFELLYSIKGSQTKLNEVINAGAYADNSHNFKLALRYADVPVYLQYRDKDGKVRLGLGLSYGRLFSASEEIDFKQDENVLSEYKKRDFCWLADIQFFVTKHIGFDFRYSYSLLYIRHFNGVQYNGAITLNPQWGTNQYNHFLTFRAMYMF